MKNLLLLPSSYTNIDPSMTSSSSSSTFVNNNNTTTTAIGKTVVKPTSYQSFESLSPLNIEDFSKQLVVYIPKLKQPQSSSSSSSFRLFQLYLHNLLIKKPLPIMKI